MDCGMEVGEGSGFYHSFFPSPWKLTESTFLPFLLQCQVRKEWVMMVGGGAQYGLIENERYEAAEFPNRPVKHQVS